MTTARRIWPQNSAAGRSFGALVEGSKRTDLSLMPVVIGIALIWLLLQLLNDRFLTSPNISNLVVQITPYAVMGLGLYFCLIAGEIDLSVGYLSGMCGAIFAVLIVQDRVDPILAMIFAVLVGTCVGVGYGLIATKFGVPTFVITLGGMLAWEGGIILVLGKVGTLNIQPNLVTDMIWTFLPAQVSVALAGCLVVVYLARALRLRKVRREAKLPALSLQGVAIRGIALAAAQAGAIVYFDTARGVPTALVVLLLLIMIAQAFVQNTKIGRYILAVGGDKEAARRAGIGVDRIRIGVMAIGTTFAAFSGILFTSRILSASLSSGGGDTLLDAIAAVVIGGTAFTGGRGSAYSALLGMLVIGSIGNGMDLLSLSSAVKLMVTGGVLVAAVVIDSLNRRRSSHA